MVALWIAAIVPSIVAAIFLPALLSNSFTAPGSQADRAAQVLHDHFGVQPDGSFVVVDQHPVIRIKPGETDPDIRQTLQPAAARVAAVLPHARVVSIAEDSPTVRSAVIATALDEVGAKRYVERANRAMGRAPAGSTLLLTGAGPVAKALEPVSTHDLERGELYFGVPVAILMVLFVFGTLASALPLIFAATVLPVTIGVVWIAAHDLELSTYITNLIVGIGLGVSVDYSLLVHSRFREELARTPDDREGAVVRTMVTAGRAVVFSGTAVAIGLALLLLVPLPFIRGFGLAGLIVPVVSIVCVTTLLPVLLLWVAAPLDRYRLLPRWLLDRRAHVTDDGSGWMRVSGAIMRRPWPFAIGSVALLLLFAFPIHRLQLTPGQEAGFPTNTAAVHGLDILEHAVGGGAFAPTELVVDTRRAGGADTQAVRSALSRVQQRVSRDPEVAAAAPPAAGEAEDAAHRYLRLTIVGRDQYGQERSQSFVRRLRADLIPQAGFPHGVRVLTGGAAPLGVDFLRIAYGSFIWLAIAVLVLTYVLLLRAFRSLLIPLKALVLNLLSIGAAYGLMVLAFRDGWGSWAGLHHVSQVEGWIPIFMFAMLFGLSMDYEVFLVSRMREAWDDGEANTRAVGLGLARTGRLVTAAGAIMVAAFGGFTSATFASIQQFGFGLAVAVLVDVTIVRVILLPSAMQLLGRWNWWLPVWVARVARVEPSPLAPRS